MWILINCVGVVFYWVCLWCVVEWDFFCFGIVMVLLVWFCDFGEFVVVGYFMEMGMGYIGFVNVVVGMFVDLVMVM